MESICDRGVRASGARCAGGLGGVLAGRESPALVEEEVHRSIFGAVFVIPWGDRSTQEFGSDVACVGSEGAANSAIV